MARNDIADGIVGTLGAVPAPIDAEGTCQLCRARFTREQALEGGFGPHKPGCPWQRARALQAEVFEQLLAQQPRPAETPVTMAFRLVVAGVANAHRRLDEGDLLGLLVGLQRLALELGCDVQFSRQVQKSMRDDTTLEARLTGWLSSGKLGGIPHAL